MVRAVDVSGAEVRVEIAPTIPGCPLKSYFHEVVPERIQHAYPQVAAVELVLSAILSEPEAGRTRQHLDDRRVVLEKVHDAIEGWPVALRGVSDPVLISRTFRSSRSRLVASGWASSTGT